MNYQSEIQPRKLLDWTVFLAIHLILIGGIGYAAFSIYRNGLALWVACSALIAGAVSLYLFHVAVPGETFMKIWLGLAVALNAAYLVHNGARQIGVEAFNSAQVRKFEVGMAAASKAPSRQVARLLGLNARNATELERVFGDGVALVAALLAFVELASAIVIFAIASKRPPASAQIPRTNVLSFPAARLNGETQWGEDDRPN